MMDELPRITHARLNELRRLAKDYPRTALIKAFKDGQLSVKASADASENTINEPAAPHINTGI